MGYRSDVRILIKEKDFNIMEKHVKDKMKKEECYIIGNYDIKKERYTNDSKTKFIYFGWNDIKWYSDEPKEYKEVCLIDDFVKGLNDYHFVRMGEGFDDLEEFCELRSYIECIEIIRKFEE